jgi:hypothetical protein
MIRIISAEPLPQCRLKVTFNDGVGGIYEDGDRRDACPTCLIARTAQPLTAWMRLSDFTPLRYDFFSARFAFTNCQLK